MDPGPVKSFEREKLITNQVKGLQCRHRSRVSFTFCLSSSLNLQTKKPVLKSSL